MGVIHITIVVTHSKGMKLKWKICHVRIYSKYPNKQVEYFYTWISVVTQWYRFCSQNKFCNEITSRCNTKI